MKRICVIGFTLVVLFSSSVLAQEIKVVQMDICTAIEEKQPVASDSVFSSDVDQLYCYTKLNSSQDTSAILHVWLHGDKEMAKVNLTMKAKAWRTWSSKKIVPEWTGQWRVQLQKADGTVVSEKSFVVK